MRVDIVSIFPDYLAPLELSLAGRARERGLLEVTVHDLRRWTHDRHRTVDDTPYGGGAGMVMKPEPWGEALDEVLTPGATLVVPTPGGTPFTQEVARELAGVAHLVVACGRYEGIDQRVPDHYATGHDVRELSIGDYVLNGGEVAALVVVEAVARLLPGFMGNAASLVEESHEAGLLEYPSYTKPASWRGLDVPPVLLSGNHAAIEAWRHQQAVARTVRHRPDLAHPARTVEVAGVEGSLTRGVPADAGELETLVWACFPPGERDLPDPTACLVLRVSGRLVGAVGAGPLRDGAWQVGPLLVAPDLRGRGLGRELLARAEAAAPDATTSFTGTVRGDDARAVRMWRRAGYRDPGGASGRLAKRVD